MKVLRWGDDLAIRFPAAIVEELNLKEGDEIDLRIAGERFFAIALDRTREQALERIRALRKDLPTGWKFDRDDVNRR
jgi:antitoxin MazE